MKVKELIEFLSELDPELECFVDDMEWGTTKLNSPDIRSNITIQHHFTDKPDDEYEKGVVF